MASGKRKAGTLPAMQRETGSLPALVFGAYEFFFDSLDGYYVAKFGDFHKAIAWSVEGRGRGSVGLAAPRRLRATANAAVYLRRGDTVDRG
jgi:hypothetical protein